MGHVIAGGAMGRDMALYGADVLNIWRPRDSEIEAFAWDVQVGMRSTILDDSKEDRARFNQLLRDADVFFANKRPGFLKRHDLDAEALCEQKPGLIHATDAARDRRWHERLFSAGDRLHRASVRSPFRVPPWRTQGDRS
jgi:crotonobetainyl-CoA:carnitine CoA-transferase CaiB-like acyl-CoA transferase